MWDELRVGAGVESEKQQDMVGSGLEVRGWN